jgi:hypothetical protein
LGICEHCEVSEGTLWIPDCEVGLASIIQGQVERTASAVCNRKAQVIDRGGVVAAFKFIETAVVVDTVQVRIIGTAKLERSVEVGRRALGVSSRMVEVGAPLEDSRVVLPGADGTVEIRKRPNVITELGAPTSSSKKHIREVRVEAKCLVKVSQRICAVP